MSYLGITLKPTIKNRGFHRELNKEMRLPQTLSEGRFCLFFIIIIFKYC